MKKYQCHKQVQAFKLNKIEGLRLIGEDPRDFVDVSPTFIVNHNPLIKTGCYIVVYKDGFVSCSPVDAFESGYTEVEEEEVLQDLTEDAEKQVDLTAMHDKFDVIDSVEQKKAFLSSLDERELDDFLGDLSDETYRDLQNDGIINDDHQIID